MACIMRGWIRRFPGPARKAGRPPHAGGTPHGPCDLGDSKVRGGELIHEGFSEGFGRRKEGLAAPAQETHRRCSARNDKRVLGGQVEDWVNGRRANSRSVVPCAAPFSSIPAPPPSGFSPLSSAAHPTGCRSHRPVAARRAGSHSTGQRTIVRTVYGECRVLSHGGVPVRASVRSHRHRSPRFRNRTRGFPCRCHDARATSPGVLAVA